MLFPCQKNVLPYRYLQFRLASSTTRVVLKDGLNGVAYKPEFVEKNKYARWERLDSFKAEIPSSKPPFSMVLPPPNITGKLHLGHALACTIQDVIVRRKRSLGYNVLWLPGTDHAGIATQGVVEKHLKSKHNIDRQDLGREKFNEEVLRWKKLHGDEICNQLRIMGCSLDWSRQVFTMDERHTKAVNHAFVTLFQKGLIYRKKALVNWCRKLKSTVSDIEVESITIDKPTDFEIPGYPKPVKFGLMYNFAYKIFDSSEEIVVSTTMPETMLGDTAIAVNPADTRYQHLRGKMAVHPFMNNRLIPIIFDEFVEMDFGTGAVKITPAHSKVDYEIAKQHKLPLLQVIDEEGNMVNAAKFTFMKRYECRKQLVHALTEMGLMKSVSPHQMSLPICSRSGGIIDHIPKEQWFLSCHKLNKKAIELVETGKLNIIPEKYVRNWLDWNRCDKDWCISRQLWWGHQIPAYKCCSDRDYVWIAAEDEFSARKQATKYLRRLPDQIEVTRDSDVLDTWFSSGIYPFASLGWPDKYKGKDLDQFYPLSLMATGHDILGFWVQRMVILGLELTGELPFKDVLLHGIICDNKGAKMSKSKGNVINPLDIIHGMSMKGLGKRAEEMFEDGVISKEELDKAKAYHKSNFSTTNGIPNCGVDALRFTLLSQDVKNNFVQFDVHLCHSNKLFCNKIWQSIKYTSMAFDKLRGLDGELTDNDLTHFDRWILSKLAELVDTVNNSLDSYDFHIATKALKTHIYNEFCDFYLESTKPGFESGDQRMRYAHAHTLSAVLNTSLRCLAPFMIYLTDELISKIPQFENNIICNFFDDSERYFDFPVYEDFKRWRNTDVEERTGKLMNAVHIVRQLKGTYNISNRVRPVVCIESSESDLISDIGSFDNVFLNLTRCGAVLFEKPNWDKRLVTSVMNKETRVSVELIADDPDEVISSSKSRLVKKIQKIEQTLMRFDDKFASDKYRETVPQWTQILDREKYTTISEELKQLKRLVEE